VRGTEIYARSAGVVEVRERHLVFGADLLPDDDLVDIVKFVPIFIEGFHISITKEQ